METATLSADDFFKRWKQIGGAPREAQKIFKGWDLSKENTRRVLLGCRWGVLEGVDPNERNFVGATVLHMREGKVGCLLRLEPNVETKVSF
jgi:AP-2 complex subunit alpha